MKVKGVTKTKFKRALVAATGCRLQHTGWPCGGCFAAALGHDQTDWIAVLAYRGDYDKDHRQVTPSGVVYRMATDTWFKVDGTFSHHVFTEFAESTLQAQIQKLAARLETPQ